MTRRLEDKVAIITGAGTRLSWYYRYCLDSQGNRTHEQDGNYADPGNADGASRHTRRNRQRLGFPGF